MKNELVLLIACFALPGFVLAQDPPKPVKKELKPVVTRRVEAAAAQVQEVFDGAKPEEKPMDPYEEIENDLEEETLWGQLKRNQNEQGKLQGQIDIKDKKSQSLKQELAESQKDAESRRQSYQDKAETFRRLYQLKADLPSSQNQVDKEKAKRNGLIAGAVATAVLGGGFFAGGIALGMLAGSAGVIALLVMSLCLLGAGALIATFCQAVAARHVQEDAQPAERRLKDQKEEIAEIEANLI